MRPALPYLALLLIAACAGPDRAASALVSLDPAARAAGIEVEIAGERLAPELPVAVDPADETWVSHGHTRERLVTAPGEWVEITGTEGAMRRGAIEPNRLLLTGDAATAQSLAELFGAGLSPMGGDRWALDAPGVVWIASMFARDRHVASGLGASPFAERLAGSDTAWVARGNGVFPETEAATIVRVIDAAALVGVYRHADVQLILDATGGYTLVTSATRAHGTFDAFPRGVRLTRDDGEVAELDLCAEALRDGAGLDLAPATAQGDAR